MMQLAMIQTMLAKNRWPRLYNVLHRVVVTGAGVVSSVGNDLRSFWQGCLEKKSVISPIPGHWSEYWKPKSKVWAPLNLPDYRAKGAKSSDFAQYDVVSLNAITVTAEALQNASLQVVENETHSGSLRVVDYDQRKTGVYFGTGVGGVRSFTENLAYNTVSATRERLKSLISRLENVDQGIIDNLNVEAERLSHPKRFNPFVVPRTMPNSVSAAVGIRYSALGSVETACVACASGTIAVGKAYRAIARGDIDLAITGGTEYLDEHSGGLFRGFDEARTLTTYDGDAEKSNRPFDKNRAGFLFSQGGAAALTLERYETAVRRGAPILAEIVGFEETFDAYSLMSVKPDGAELRVMLHRLLKSQRLAASDVQYINAHGTGTLVNDEVEAAVLESVFGNQPVVNSTKSILGHTIGASGALEAVVTAMSISSNKTHGCVNLESPIRELNFPTETVDVDIAFAISQSSAFGGHNAALLFSRVS